MVEFRNAAEAKRLAQLVGEERKKKFDAGKKDRWGWPPVRKGRVRGHVTNMRMWDEPGAFGVTHNISLELREDPKQPGVPVLMQGTDVEGRIIEGMVMEVEDRNPKVRPIIATEIIYSHSVLDGPGRTHSVRTYYPGRDDEPPRRNLAVAISMVAVPTLVLLVSVYLLRYVWHVLS